MLKRKTEGSVETFEEIDLENKFEEEIVPYEKFELALCKNMELEQARRVCNHFLRESKSFTHIKLPSRNLHSRLEQNV